MKETTSATLDAVASNLRTVVLATRRRRLAAMLYELLLLIGVVGGGVVLPWVAVGMALGWVPPGWWLWLQLIAVLTAYFVWHWHRRGATLAMKTWRLRLLSADGKPPSLQQCLRRYMLAWPSVLTGLGLLWSLWDRDGQWWHDRVAGTRVVEWRWEE